ncbi:MAG: glycosyltransferase [Planctomycetes bacterium]|nr:glycosyltransferase [Planctomycetota bacterium]
MRIVVPSRDSGDEIVETVRRLLAQDHRAEIVLVDDRSEPPLQDNLRQALGSTEGFEIRRIDALPDGWLGKPHACSVGSEDFEGEWLLFLDDDTWAEPDFLRRLLSEAGRSTADHLCLLPLLRGTTWSGRALVTAMAFGMLQRIHGLERDRPGPGFGVGACTLIRRSTYEAIGGHRARPLAVLEDIELANAVRRDRHRSRLRTGIDVVSVRWIEDACSSFRLLRKNWFAAFDYRWPLLLAAVGSALLVWFSTITGVFLAETKTARTLALSGLSMTILLAALHARRVGWSPWIGFAAPIAQPLIPATMLWSALRTQLDGGVRWREAFHPLEELRKAARAVTR